ncbi:hypothetical protein IAQ61_006659, partial [Plenodomus lingam]|uniref:Predicted protein n=1 Tax=Leptosphaeria maculans (strain JN3 / isolate v23.1.3 / race Av1-4-5-6-7-8) TaxID=985895 RepID=E5AC71_LEPMJ
MPIKLRACKRNNFVGRGRWEPSRSWHCYVSGRELRCNVTQVSGTHLQLVAGDCFKLGNPRAVARCSKVSGFGSLEPKRQGWRWPQGLEYATLCATLAGIPRVEDIASSSYFRHPRV